MALGAFLAGVLLADSEYRHELEADIEPFKGLLLGLFFIAVGMTANLGLLLEHRGRIAAARAGLLVVKAWCCRCCARLTRHSARRARAHGVRAAAGGEFAFVLFALRSRRARHGSRARRRSLVIVVTCRCR